ncbi:hypothetical protein [Bacillus sp. JCM 19034]|uniref:hypothetical protein n=1 Tax=Bacillus sp. JCM 19034 TaxID=1481928 RepID=UPI001E488BE2|nr:hypothetical protein [Bacillus sp. JCM 19034]
MKKPNGITVLRKRDIAQLLWPKPIEEMHGIGRRTVDKWKKLSIHSIGDLANSERDIIVKKFGERGLKLQDRANGIDERRSTLTHIIGSNRLETQKHYSEIHVNERSLTRHFNS